MEHDTVVRGESLRGGVSPPSGNRFQMWEKYLTGWFSYGSHLEKPERRLPMPFVGNNDILAHTDPERGLLTVVGVPYWLLTIGILSMIWLSRALRRFRQNRR